MSAVCSEVDCAAAVIARGWCWTHYYALREAPICSAGDCDRKIIARGLCAKHYARLRVNGDLELRRREKGTGYVMKGRYGGYKYIKAKGHPNANRTGYVREHILVMANALGRPIRDDEIIHHRNGIRDDNRLENLELWKLGHPPGQRVADQLAWAVEFIEQYADDPLVWTPELAARLVHLKGATR